MCHTASEKEQPVYVAKQRLDFACHEDLPCFTQCCQDVNIFLTPYDVLRLRRALNIGSGEFLEDYTYISMGRATGIPLVQLLMDPDTLYCRLVSDSGCTVYEDRPWACRIYPLDVTPVEGEYTAIVGKDKCFGFLETSRSTVEEWIEGQGVLPYVEMDQVFHSAMPKNLRPGAPMNETLGRLLYMAYDLDRFAALLDDPEFRASNDIDDETLAKARKSDEALLRLAFKYIQGQMEGLYRAA